MNKKLYKSRQDRMLCGVCSGIAEYFNVDPVLVRVVFVVLFFAGGSAFIAYIIGCIIIPERPRGELTAASQPASAAASATSAASAASGDMRDIRSVAVEERGNDKAQAGALFIGIILIVLGAVLLLKNIPIFDHYFWWFRHYAWRFFWPGLIIVIGLALIFRGSKK